MEQRPPQTPHSRLVITADDYGYGPSYDRGLLEAARAGAIDSASAMVLRPGCDPGALLQSGIEIGLHLELPSEVTVGTRAGPTQRATAVAALCGQLERFEELFGQPGAYLDGHHHCHAAPGLASAIARVARERDLPVRAIDPRHRRLLRCVGVATPDRLVGRTSEAEPMVPPEIQAILDGDPPPGVTEWMVHPGHGDPDHESTYDAAREQDLTALLELAGDERLSAVRGTRAETLGL